MTDSPAPGRVPRWSTDVTRFCGRLADRMAADDCRFPVVAAVALAVRGRDGLDRQAFATSLGIDVEQLEQAEGGMLPLEELPRALVERARETLDLDWGDLRRITAV